MNKKIVVLIISFLMSLNIMAQQTIDGTITDEGGNPLANVSIMVKGAEIKSVSDENGKYFISIPAGYNILQFSLIEFISSEMEVKDKVVNVVLVKDLNYFGQSLEQLMNIEVITVSKKAESNFNAPLSSSVITKEDIKNAGANSIPEALRLFPGLIVREQTNGVYDVHLRGFDYVVNSTLPYSNNSITLVMIDGRPVFRDFQGGTYWESLPVDLCDVERIEVVRGPASSMYGVNAVAGVINIITKRFKDDDYNSEFVYADMQRGNFNTNLYNFNAGFKKNNFSAGISSNFKERNRFESNYYDFKRQTYVDLIDSVQGRAANSYAFTKDKNKRYPNPNLATSQYGINSFINYVVNENINFDFSFGLQKSEAQKAYADVTYTPFTIDRSETQYANFKANVYGLNIQASHLNGYQNTLGVSGWEYNFKNTELNVEYDLNLLDNKLSIRPGFNYKSAIYNDSLSRRSLGTGLINTNDADLSTIAGMLRLDYQISDKLRFIASLRLDQYNYPDKNALSYQFGFTYKPSEEHLVRLVASRANKGSIILDNYINLNIKNVFIYSNNKNLNLTTIDMYEFGYRGRIFEKMQIDLEVFYQQAKDFTAISLTDSIVAGRYYLSAHNLSMKPAQTGITLNVIYVPNGQLQIKPFITWQKTEIKNFAANIDKQNITETINNEWTPTFYGGLVINYAASEKLNFNFNFYGFSQSYFKYYGAYTSKAVINDLYLLNIKTLYKITDNLSVSMNVRNINLGSQIVNDKLDVKSERQFGFTDNIKPLFLFGLNLDL